LVVNLDNRSPINIRRGDKIAQLVVQQVETANIEEVDELPDTPRGEGGFGSTGR
jgi:dUTP pyrophosphatase